MNYIIRHWRGDLSLAKSFWINLFIVDCSLWAIYILFVTTSFIENPITVSRITIFYLLFIYFIVFPWQVVGLWNTTNRYIESIGKRFWPYLVKVLVLFGIIFSAIKLSISWPLYNDLYSLGFRHNKIDSYSVELSEDGDLIHLKGGLFYGVSKAVEDLIDSNQIRGIIIDSSGGVVYEGRKLAKIIINKKLDTFTIDGCYSSCTLAFISGEHRYLSKGANLGFHQYGSLIRGVDVDYKDEQYRDLMLFKNRGIRQDFLDRLYNAESNDLWYPTMNELLTSGVVHEIINPSSIRRVIREKSGVDEFDGWANDISAFQVIKQYSPDTYNSIVGLTSDMMDRGASRIEVIEKISLEFSDLADRSMSRTSDEAIIALVKQIVLTSDFLNSKSPILCMKSLHPEQYGTLDSTMHLSMDTMMSMLDSLGLVIEDSFKTPPSIIDIDRAELLVMEIIMRMGSRAEYLEIEGLNNGNDYSKSCQATIDFFGEIVSLDKEQAGNVLRYMFSE